MPPELQLRLQALIASAEDIIKFTRHENSCREELWWGDEEGRPQCTCGVFEARRRLREAIQQLRSQLS